jgi:hypothetical protein
MNPDHPYYDDWALDFSDRPYPSHPPVIDLAKVVIVLWIVLGSLLGCSIENRGGRISVLEPAPVVIETRPALTLDEPVLRILETFGGRLRIIVQDPVTRHYRVVD